MIKQIGDTAGKIWDSLGQKGEMNIAQMPRSMKLKSQDAYQALGWLARENKIQYTNKSGKTYVCLTPTEQNAYDLLQKTQAR
jgi:hypothetical protein